MPGAISLVTLLASVLTMAIASPVQSRELELDVPYVSTPYIVVDHMLEMADVGPGDYVIDLGSGDGRIVMAAVMRGAQGHGVDLDPERVAEAKANASRERLHHRLLFLEQDVFDTDVSRATVVTMYLLPSINVKLQNKLIESLEPGSRIVSHNFDIGEWQPDDWKSVKVRDRNHIIYYWIVPARVKGRWVSDIEQTTVSMEIQQDFQKLTIDLDTGDDTFWTVQEAILKGDRIAFTANARNQRYIFNGRVEEDKIRGMVQIYEKGDERLQPWNAQRQ